MIYNYFEENIAFGANKSKPFFRYARAPILTTVHFGCSYYSPFLFEQFDICLVNCLHTPLDSHTSVQIGLRNRPNTIPSNSGKEAIKRCVAVTYKQTAANIKHNKKHKTKTIQSLGYVVCEPVHTGEKRSSHNESQQQFCERAFSSVMFQPRIQTDTQPENDFHETFSTGRKKAACSAVLMVLYDSS